MSDGVGGWVGEQMSTWQSFSQWEKMHNFEKLRTGHKHITLKTQTTCSYSNNCVQTWVFVQGDVVHGLFNTTQRVLISQPMFCKTFYTCSTCVGVWCKKVNSQLFRVGFLEPSRVHHGTLVPWYEAELAAVYIIHVHARTCTCVCKVKGQWWQQLKRSVTYHIWIIDIIALVFTLAGSVLFVQTVYRVRHGHTIVLLPDSAQLSVACNGEMGKGLLSFHMSDIFFSPLLANLSFPFSNTLLYSFSPLSLLLIPISSHFSFSLSLLSSPNPS